MAWSDIDDKPSLIRPFLAERGLALKKRWGQNFMVSRHERERIVSLLEVESGDSVWEIGSGLGGITDLVLGHVPSVTVFEVDYGLARVMEDRFGDRIQMVLGDAVATVAENPVPDRIIGNLPYRSAAAIISTLLERPEILESVGRMVFTVQKEMAQRMAATPGTRAYSAFSVLCQLAGTVRTAGDISRASFYPAPDVTSSIVVIEPVIDHVHLLPVAATVSRSLFQSRRKTVSNNAETLARHLDVDKQTILSAMRRVGVPLDVRAEELPPKEFLNIASQLDVK
jgi:16S rRNA (adenine1518-N6/adenine1519-N6)-dimethyltransferase